MGTVRYTVLDGEIVSENRNGTERDYVPDPLGSTVALLDNTQAQTDTFGYWPYGEERSRTGTSSMRFRFLGAQGYFSDAAVRSYVRARSLSISTARWFSVDPASLATTRHPYAYGENNPVNTLDRAGLLPFASSGCRAARPQVSNAISTICRGSLNLTCGAPSHSHVGRCLRRWCGSNEVVYCDTTSPECNLPGVGGWLDDFDTIRLCPNHLNAGHNGVPPPMSYAYALLHELMHRCGIQDFNPGVPTTPPNPNPADLMAVCLLGLQVKCLNAYRPEDVWKRLPRR
jgi:RHS repeat-associated protein